LNYCQVFTLAGSIQPVEAESGSTDCWGSAAAAPFTRLPRRCSHRCK